MQQAPYVAAAILLVGVLVLHYYPKHDGLVRSVEVDYGITICPGRGEPLLRRGGAVPPSNAVGSWPRFRGPEGTGIAPDDGVRLLRHWPSDGPRELWRRPVGNGHAGVAIDRGRVYLTDYDPTLFPDPENDHEPIGGDIIRCLSLADGVDIWTYAYPITTVPNHGVSRATPAVSGRYLVSAGPQCHVICLDAMTGEHKWSMDLVKEYGAQVPKWYAGQSPLIDGEHAIIAPSGKAGAGVESTDDVLMVKVELASGDIVWEAENTLRSLQTHVSITTMDLYGTKAYLYSGSRGLAAVAAATGEVIWENTTWFNKIANCADPVPLPGHRLFLSAGYGAGCMMLRIDQDAEGKLSEEVLWTKPEKEFGSVQHTPIVDPIGEVLYGIRVAGDMVCMDLDGQIRWSSGRGSTNTYGIGPYIASTQRLIIALSGDGRLDLLAMDPTAFQRLGSFQAFPDSSSAWGPMALAGGRLIARDLTSLACFDITTD